jgi:hypothetical protein
MKPAFWSQLQARSAAVVIAERFAAEIRPFQGWVQFDGVAVAVVLQRAISRGSVAFFEI